VARAVTAQAPAPRSVGDVLVFRVNGFESARHHEAGHGAQNLRSSGGRRRSRLGARRAARRKTEGRAAIPDRTSTRRAKAEIPSLQISTPDGKRVGRTQPFTIDVQSAIAADDQKPQQPVDPRPPVSLNFPMACGGARGPFS